MDTRGAASWSRVSLECLGESASTFISSSMHLASCEANQTPWREVLDAILAIHYKLHLEQLNQITLSPAFFCPVNKEPLFGVGERERERDKEGIEN